MFDPPKITTVTASNGTTTEVISDKLLWFALEQLGRFEDPNQQNYRSLLGPCIANLSDLETMKEVIKELTSPHGIDEKKALFALDKLLDKVSKREEGEAIKGEKLVARNQRFMLDVYPESMTTEYHDDFMAIGTNPDHEFGVYVVQSWFPNTARDSEWVFTHFNSPVESVQPWWGNGKFGQDPGVHNQDFQQLRLTRGNHFVSFRDFGEAIAAAEKSLPKLGVHQAWQYSPAQKSCVCLVADSAGGMANTVVTIQYYWVGKKSRERREIPQSELERKDIKSA